MKNILRLEEFAMFAGCAYALNAMAAPWWCYLLLLVGPDISMLGYLFGNGAGAVAYNIFHHKGIAIILFGVGFYMDNITLQITGLILFGHASLDRVFGYGLKYDTGFKFTHLGEIGKGKLPETN